MATSSSGTASTTYAYDHTSERVKKTVGSVTTLYANDYWNKQGTGAGATTTRQIYGNGEVIATVEGNGTATSTNYAHGDQLGSVGVSTDGNGNVTEATDYYPYGAERVATGSYSGQRKYIGEVYDEESSMSYLNARYYQNTRGQFISQDPVFWEIGLTSDGKKVLQSPQAQNSYSYAGNNPLTNKDPTGRDYLEVTGSLDIQPISGNIGARFDFKNGRIDISYGGGFATGLSTSLTGFYSTDDLPTANNYITESGDVTFSPFGLAAKVGGSNTQTIENPSKSKLNLGVTPGVAVGIGEGYSRSATVNYNFTFIDVRNQRGFLFQIQKDLNKISKSLQQIGKIFRQSVNNKNNNKKSP
jgi:RHS repeat-associated protein